MSLLKTEQEDQLDETRSNEAHLRHVIHQQDPCNIQGPCPSKPFEGLEQCLPWHQRAWGRLTHGCSCHRRRILRSCNEDQPPSNTTTSRTQWLMYMQDIAFPVSLRSSGRDSMRRVERTMNVPPYSAGTDMRPGATTSNVDRISETAHGAMSTWRNEREMNRISARLWDSSGVPSTYLASRPLLGRDGQDSEVIPGYRRRTAPRMTSMEILLYVGHQTMKIVEDWLLAFRLTYLIHVRQYADTQVKILLTLEGRQIQVIEEQATGETQFWDQLPHRRVGPCMGDTDIDRVRY